MMRWGDCCYLLVAEGIRTVGEMLGRDVGKDWTCLRWVDKGCVHDSGGGGVSLFRILGFALEKYY